MLILHTFDWHLRRTLHGASLGDNVGAFTGWLVTPVREYGIDAVLISGDVFDRTTPPVDVLARMRRALRELTEITTLILTSGNRDGATCLGLFAGILAPSLHVVTDPKAIGMSIETGGALVYPTPCLEPDLVRQSLLDLSARGEADLPISLPCSHQAALGAVLRQVRADLSARRDVGDERPTITMPYVFVTGTQASDPERDVQVGSIPSVSAGLLDTLGDKKSLIHGLDYVAAGHLHRPQDISGTSVPVRYADSPIAYSFSEAGVIKPITPLTTDIVLATDIGVASIPTPWGIMVPEGTMDELLADPDEATAALYVPAMIIDDTRPKRMTPCIREVYPYALVVVYHPSQALALAPAMIMRASRDLREVTGEFYEVMGGRVLSAQERKLALDVWAQLRGRDVQ